MRGNLFRFLERDKFELVKLGIFVAKVISYKDKGFSHFDPITTGRTIAFGSLIGKAIAELSFEVIIILI